MRVRASASRSKARFQRQQATAFPRAQPRSSRLRVEAVQASDDSELASNAPFNASIRVPNAMAAAYGSAGSGGATLERSKSKLSLQQQQKSWAPNLEAGGGGGGIGNKVINGGGGGGDDDDDDEYFQEDDGEDPNDTKWWHKVPLKQLYDSVTVRAVLSEWCTTVEALPSFLRMLASMQYYSSAQWVRYLTMQDRPNVFRAVERTLAHTLPDARSAFVGRVLADPAFVQKTSIEAGIAFSLTFAHELHVRGRRIGSELHAALINSTCMAVAAAACSSLVAPAKTPSPPAARFPFQKMLMELPNNAFEVSTPTRRFAVSQRVSTFVAKAVEISAVYAVAGGVSVGLQQCVKAARTSQDPRYKQVTPVAGISRTAGGMGVYGAVAANTRLQAASGLERVLLEYAKVNTTWQVIGLAALFRGLSLAALENPLGWGPRPVVQCSRAALAGEPTVHIPGPRPRLVKRMVKRRVKRASPEQAVAVEWASLQSIRQCDVLYMSSCGQR